MGTTAPYYAAEVRTPVRTAAGGIDNDPDAQRPWVKLDVATSTVDAAWKLRGGLITHGAHHSELHDHVADLVDGHVLTMDDGYAFRVVARNEPADMTTSDLVMEYGRLRELAGSLGRNFTDANHRRLGAVVDALRAKGVLA